MNEQQLRSRVQAAATGAVGVAATGDEDSDDDIELPPVVQNPIGRDAAGDRDDDDDDEAYGGRRKSRRTRRTRRTRRKRRTRRTRRTKKSKKSKK